MYNILLVDDEILIREAISENIKWEELGFKLIGTCQNGKEAIDFLEDNHVDVLLTDIWMPIVDGIELIKYTYNNFPEISVIVFSGFDEFEYAQKAIRYNVEEYILKPVTAAELSKTLTDVKARRDKRIEKENNWNKINETYKKNKIYIKSKLLIEFITGKKTLKDSAHELESFNIELNENYYRVAIIELKGGYDYLEENEEKNHNCSLMSFSVYNISEEVLKNSQAGIVCLSNDNKLYILLKSNSLADIKSKAKEICLDIKGKVKEYLQVDISITIGTTVTNKENIYKSYELANTAIKYQYILGEHSVIDGEEIQNLGNGEKKYIDLDNYINDLSKGIMTNDMKMINQTVNSLKDKLDLNFSTKTLTISYLQRIVLDLTDEVSVSDLLQSQDGLYKEEILADLAKTLTLSSGINILKDYCHNVASTLMIQKGSTNKKRALLAMDFIEKNHGDPSLSLSEVCLYLNISSSRFSTIFKDETGQTFMEFLTRIRIEKSKVLLENSDLKHYEIAVKVGFSDPQYFSVVFKKITGQSPTEYTKDMKNNI